MHLAGELLKTKTGLDMMHIPYKGSAPAYPDVMAGRVDLMIDTLFSSKPHIETGRLRPLAITSAQRAQTSPDIPTVAETVPGFDVQSINGIVVPKATPREIVRKLHADFSTILQLPELRTRMAELGLEVVTMTPEGVRRLHPHADRAMGRGGAPLRRQGGVSGGAPLIRRDAVDAPSARSTQHLAPGMPFFSHSSDVMLAGGFTHSAG